MVLKYGTENLDWRKICRIFDRAPLGHRDPDKLRRAAKNSFLVCTAHHGREIIGFGRAMSDGEYQSAIYDVVVLPEHQGRGVGRAIMDALLARLPPGPVLIYVAPGKEGFYEHFGFQGLKTAMGRFPDPGRARDQGYI
ncbi:MAG: GNAT family N-acetyltransferase [Proteobacteria bacterium]|nr:GNAT family N-acetyltransferase [Pseudomonadota bacterium]MBU1742347.1 GNAT family N-acetyltransferase [Pseudomonadota bacterium]